MKSPVPAATPEKGAPSPQNIWKLVAPDWAQVDTIWRNDLPFVLWPVGNQPLLAHWMDEAVRRGVDLVELYVADRPAEVRAWLDEGAYWSRRVRLIPIRDETQAPEDAQCTDHLPGVPALPFAKTSSTLLAYWFALQEQWLAQRSSETVAVERLHPTGGWVGGHTRIHPSAHLKAPFWIGRRVRIGPDCQIGPNALIGDGAILDSNVIVENACVQPHTYLGRNTGLSHAAAAGNVLLDFRRSCRVEIPERFIMGAVVEGSQPGFFSRLLALLCWLLLSPLSLLWSQDSAGGRAFRCRGGETIILPLLRAGPLWLRRLPWLKQIVVGRMFWIGILPRGSEDLARMPEETGLALQNAPAGMFSLADAHGCHDVSDPEEWIHATYQASAAAAADATSIVLRNLWKIAWSRKTSLSPA